MGRRGDARTGHAGRPLMVSPIGAQRHDPIRCRRILPDSRNSYAPHPLWQSEEPSCRDNQPCMVYILYRDFMARTDCSPMPCFGKHTSTAF